MNDHLHIERPWWRDLLAILIVVPAPSIGVFMAMGGEETTTAGQVTFAICKLWMFVAPLIWHLAVDRAPVSWSPARKGGWRLATALGIAIMVVIIGAYFLIGRHLIDAAAVAEVSAKTGLDQPARYIGLVIYWIVVNSVLEEFVYRWFLWEKCRRFLPSWGATLASATFFTIHHVFALWVQFDWRVTVLASIGVFAGGAIWSWLYARTGSIWPAWVSHAFADVGVFTVGAIVIYG